MTADELAAIDAREAEVARLVVLLKRQPGPHLRDGGTVSAAEHYEAQAAEAGELARLRAFAEAVAQPTTGYQCWHVAAAKAALNPRPPARRDWVDVPLPLDEQAP